MYVQYAGLLMLYGVPNRPLRKSLLIYVAATVLLVIIYSVVFLFLMSLLKVILYRG